MFADDMILYVYVENPEDSIDTLFELINRFS